MRMLLIVSILVFSLLGCSSTGEGKASSYGGYIAEAERAVPLSFHLRRDDRLAVVFPGVPYREERAVELASREYLSHCGIKAFALSDIYPGGLEEEAIGKEVGFALTDADTDYLLVVSVLESRESVYGSIAERVFSVSLRNYRTGGEAGRFTVTVQGEGEGTYEDSVVPVARAFSKALGESLLVLYR